MTMNDDDLLQIARQILGGDLLKQPIVLKLGEFKRFYEYFIEVNDRVVPDVTAIHLGDQVFLIFPEHSRQEIVVEPEHRRKIFREDFNFVPIIKWKGANRPALGFHQFVLNEIKISKIRLGLTFFFSSAILFFISPNLDVINLVNSLLIQASTVFLSIYLIFTVSQSERLSSDRKLFEKGILYQYYSDDRYITIFAILTIAFTFLNTILVHLPGFQSHDSLSLNYLGRWVISMTTGVAFTMLFHTFIIVGDYYLERTRDIAERQHIEEILHEEYKNKNLDSR